ncbi:Dual specificity protein phosphatase-like protein [Hapsidospora chrysogenum ATCC 11550]|uniref:Dual specificity protein phosphatase-like protein n=1 Tax=Hapsidospora chrysogenum (strain ATCC 11550 / CBS 779.69 / DSM 880 / IAM 14645 / JCM 23072 / IMI 49137) TaxID=857340 RepID=A0A086T4E2_HAPC1|nr:Dual specificity protein phosphatase-like protein [Hapsidospora chrysogenum ATCC 11550]
MATITLTRPLPPHRPASALDAPITPPLSLEGLNAGTSPQYKHAPVPNKHLPVCPTGPAVEEQLETPPVSPKDGECAQASTLYPPDAYSRLDSGPLSIYELDAGAVAHAVDVSSRQLLPDPALVFPWLHGLHPHNHIQQAFFNARKRTNRKAPYCLRGVTLVKADGDLAVCRLKGALAPEELIHTGPNPEFLEADPLEGFSVRNFHIQSAKIALTSDIVVYGDRPELTRQVAWDFAAAQSRWREKHVGPGDHFPEYNTFVCTSDFREFEEEHGEIVAIDSRGYATGHVLDFVQQERKEMWDITAASEISHNVFMGPTPELGSPEERRYDILIECSDNGRLNPVTLQLVAESAGDAVTQPFHDFPSSGSIPPPSKYSHGEADAIIETCKWIYHLAHGTRPNMRDHTDIDGDSCMSSAEDDSEDGATQYEPRKILIHCGDGYTESSMLGIAYFSFSTGRPIPEAWLDLHKAKGRNFFAYPSDVALLKAIAPRLLTESPACASKSLLEITNMVRNEPSWFPGLDGSLPSRILDYLYLGNLGHANNPNLLKELGIHQVLSVGETVMWPDGVDESWGDDDVCVVEGVQDNGIDPLMDHFARCLEFIDRGRRNGTATLVHCRVGVSRSATICIAEVMRAMGMSFPRAYCFVRARRLNVIIQPHLRFAYELLRWEECLQQNGDPSAPVKHEMEWGEITREIALMNRPYAR